MLGMLLERVGSVVRQESQQNHTVIISGYKRAKLRRNSHLCSIKIGTRGLGRRAGRII